MGFYRFIHCNQEHNLRKYVVIEAFSKDEAIKILATLVINPNDWSAYD